MRLVNEELPEREPTKTVQAAEAGRETRISEFNMSEIGNESHPGRPSSFGCPDCGGVLWEIEDDGFLRFRCRVGHAYTARHLSAEQRHAVETALWAALRALEESASLYHRQAERAELSGHDVTARQFKEREANTKANARSLQEFLLNVNRVDEGVELEDAGQTLRRSN